MHILQPKHTKLKPDEVKVLVEKYNLSLSQLPKVLFTDPTLPEHSVAGDVIKIERKEDDGTKIYYRVVVG
ncbi:MAG TPA: DNA-directed RNA polymerase subunit RpoH/Rpb5 C-terminal domain-containing protein [Candidatus Nanoarchaeia archaeon]|nr:DNA-directed RNA polymerase subunit RpoH/Rpb5 C-terminal domain-containing protein [Candidatus Nanoarchaeia archaeon]